MKDVKMDDVRFVLERFFYGWKMNAIVFGPSITTG